MVDYSKLTSKVWRVVMDAEHSWKESLESLSYLDYQVQQWSNLLPTDLKLNGTLENESASLGETRLMLKALLRLRASQLRIILRKPHLLSRERIAQNVEAVEVVVDYCMELRVYTKSTDRLSTPSWCLQLLSFVLSRVTHQKPSTPSPP